MAKRELILTHNADELPDLLFIEEAAHFLCISERQCRAKCSNDEEGGIPFINIGNGWQIPKPRLLEWCKIAQPVNLDVDQLAKRIIEGITSTNEDLLVKVINNLSVTTSFGVKRDNVVSLNAGNANSL